MPDEIQGKPGDRVQFGHAPNFCPHCGKEREAEDTRWYTRDGDWLCSECGECGCHYGVQGSITVLEVDDEA